MKILIVDDEYEERDGIAFLIKKLNMELELFFAENGRDALKFLESNYVDILYTDIRMPFMDGLELTTEALKIYPDIKVILYSGYSEFTYAKKAIRLGVSDYILKPININEFKNVMTKVIKAVNASKENQEFVKKHLLVNIINRTSDTGLFKEKYCLYFPMPHKKMVLLEFENNFFDEQGAEFEKQLMEIAKINIEGINIDYINLNMCQSVLLFSFSSEIENKKIYSLLHNLHNWFLEKFQKVCYFAISDDISGYSSLSDAFSALEHLMEYRFLLLESNIFCKDILLSENAQSKYSDSKILEDIDLNIAEKDINGLRINVNLLFDKYKNVSMYSHIYVKFIFSSLYKDIIAAFNLSAGYGLCSAIDKIYTSSDLLSLMKLVNDTLNDLESQNIDTEHNFYVNSVKKYIDEFYGKDLNLQYLAEYVHLSPHYLCTVFKKDMGFGINEYIKKIRMENASYMLKNSNKKVIDIAKAVGYHNCSYFIQTFKELYGYTPENYRKM